VGGIYLQCRKATVGVVAPVMYVCISKVQSTS